MSHKHSLPKKLAVHRVLYPSMLTESWVEGKSVEEKDVQPTESMRIVKQNRFKNLGELHKERTEAGVKTSRATTHRHVKEFGYSSNKIKSNQFYCHITTAHVPWWVKFLRACSRQCRNNLHIDSKYLQTYTEDNVQNTHTYTQYTQCTIKTYLQLSIHILHSMYTFYIMYTYTHNSMQKRCNRLYIGWIRNVMDVHWMVSSGSRCPVVQSPLFRWEQVLYFIWKPRSWNLEEGWRSS